jgi:hypothetical protein
MKKKQSRNEVMRDRSTQTFCGAQPHLSLARSCSQQSAKGEIHMKTMNGKCNKKQKNRRAKAQTNPSGSRTRKESFPGCNLCSGPRRQKKWQCPLSGVWRPRPNSGVENIYGNSVTSRREMRTPTDEKMPSTAKPTRIRTTERKQNDHTDKADESRLDNLRCRPGL